MRDTALTTVGHGIRTSVFFYRLLVSPHNLTFSHICGALQHYNNNCTIHYNCINLVNQEAFEVNLDDNSMKRHALLHGLQRLLTNLNTTIFFYLLN